MAQPYVKKTFQQMEMDAYIRADEERLFVEQIEEDAYHVTNLDHHTIYRVDILYGRVAHCECPHHVFRNNVLCKHMVAVSNETGIPTL